MKTRGFEEAELNSKIMEAEKKYLISRKDQFPRFSLEQRDKISHFILRLAFCRSEDLRRWFITQECILFKYRLDALSDDQRQVFMAQNGISYEIVSAEERARKASLLTNLAGVKSDSIDRTTFYKVPFTQALQLIANRQVYLEGGFAYVPLQRVVSIITTRFRIQVSRALAEAALMFDTVASDIRIGPLLKNMNKQYIGNDFGTKGVSTDKLTPEMVDVVAESSMPLCMKHLHNMLKKEHKLKHWGRLQYGLFLKAAHLDLDGALAFWESHFTKIMSHDQFVKSYSYNFRHMYGKEGGRKSYTPYSCLKIIMGSPPEIGAHHGCPYKHMGDNQLVNTLLALKISPSDTKDIVTLAKSGSPQLACAKHFEITHPGYQSMQLQMFDAVANHPNHWTEVSRKYYKVKSGQKIVELKEGTQDEIVVEKEIV